METTKTPKDQVIDIAVELYKGALNCRTSDNIIVDSAEYRRMLVERTKNI